MTRAFLVDPPALQSLLCLAQQMRPDAVPGGGEVGGHRSIEIVFSVAVLVWGFLLIGGLTWVMVRSGQFWNATYLRLCVLAIVVTAGLFVIVAGYTEQQIAPMMGLLGTLVGYLLGKGGDGRSETRDSG